MTQPEDESQDAALRRRRARAIAAVVGAAATFAIASALVKWIAAEIPTIQIVLFRSVVSLIALSPMIRREGGIKVLATRRLGWHVLRTVAGFGGMFTAFYGYATLPLAEVTALGFTMPLFLTALSIPLLGERVGPRRWAAVILGFLGVLLILRPGAGAVAIGPALIVVFGAVCWALSMVAIRRMGEVGESNVVIVAWFSIGGTVVAGALTLFVWVTPGLEQFLCLVGVGLVSTLAQLLMTEAYRRGETTLVAPFEYTGIVWTSLIGLAVWGERPAPTMLAGVAILIASGLYILHREVMRRRTALEDAGRPR